MQALPVGAQHALRHGRAPSARSGPEYSGLGALAAGLSAPVPPLDLPRSLPPLGARASPASSRVPDRVQDEVPGPWRAASAQRAGVSAAGSLGSDRVLEPGCAGSSPSSIRGRGVEPEEPAAGPARDLEPDPDPYYDPEPEPDSNHAAGISGEGGAANDKVAGEAEGASAGTLKIAKGQTGSL